jgi:hypothetical protein
MPNGLGPVGNDRKDFFALGGAKDNNLFATARVSPGLGATMATPSYQTPTGSAAHVTALSSVADSTSSTLAALTALSSSVQPAGSTPTTGNPAGGVPQAGTDATVADFGSITINGVTTVLGSVQAPYMTASDASSYVAAAINANEANTVTASVNDKGLLELTSKTGSDIQISAAGGSTTGLTYQQTATGFQVGNYGSNATATQKIDGPYFAENFAKTYADASGQGGSSSPSPTPAPTPSPSPTPTPAPGPAPAPTPTLPPVGGPPGQDKDKTKKKNALDFGPGSFQPTLPEAPTTAKSGGIDLTEAPLAQGPIVTPVPTPGQTSGGASLIGQLSAAQGAMDAGLTVQQHVSAASTQRVLDSLEPQTVKAEEADKTDVSKEAKANALAAGIPFGQFKNTTDQIT